MDSRFIGMIKYSGATAIDAENGRIAVCCSVLQDNEARYRLYKLDNLNEITELCFGSPHPCNRLAFDKTGQWLAAAEWSHNCYTQGWVYNIKTGEKQVFYSGQNPSYYGEVRGGSENVVFSPNGKFLVIASSKLKTIVIDVDKLMNHKHEFIPMLELEKSKMQKKKFFAWSPDGRMLAAVNDSEYNNYGRVVDIWLFSKNQLSCKLDITHRCLDWQEESVRSINGELGMDFSPDSRYLAVAGETNNGCIQLFDTHNGTMILESQCAGTDVRNIIFTPDGKFIISVTGKEVLVLWKIKYNKPSVECVDIIKLPGMITAISMTRLGDGIYVAYRNGSDLGIDYISI